MIVTQEPPFERAAIDARLSEKALLQREADEARAAIARTLASMKASVAGATDPRSLAVAHPWLSVGVAAAAGFAAATATVPGRDERAADKWSRIINQFIPTPPASPQAAAAATHQAAYATAPQAPVSATHSLWNAVFDIARVAVTNMIVDFMQRRSAAPSSDGYDRRPETEPSES